VKSLVTSLCVVLTVVLLLLGGCKSKEEAPARAAIGLPAPPFTLTDTEGKRWSLAELRGKVLFVNFWATWCPPCRGEMPSMEALNRSMQGKPFQMLTILVNDDPALARNFVASLGGTFPVLVSPDDAVGKAYGITGVPETFIIDGEGLLREKHIGPRDWNSEEAKAMLRSLIP